MGDDFSEMSAGATPDVPPLLVLDLDGTLLATEKQGEMSSTPDFTSASGGEGKALTDTFLRPGLAGFIAAVLRHGFQLAVWTAAPRIYAEAMIDGIDRVAFPGFRDLLAERVFTEEHTTSSFERGRIMTTKDLQKLVEPTGVPVHRILIVDDTPGTYALNVRNALPIEPFMAGEVDDQMLGELATFLGTLDLSPSATLDVSEWEYAPETGDTGPLSVEAVRQQTRRAKRLSMAGGGPPMAAWAGQGSMAGGLAAPDGDE